MTAAPCSSAPSALADTERCEATILVIESAASLGRELVEQLHADNYRAALALTAEHARMLAHARPIRAIILGALEGPRAALDLLDEVRHSSGLSNDGQVWDECLPVIVLSAGAEQLDLLRAFDMGADDFIARTNLDYLELRARLRATLRRAEGKSTVRLLRVGALEIDTHAHRVCVAGAHVHLCRLEYELLVHLAHNPTGVCSKQELLNSVWRQHAEGGLRTVDSHASRLRRKLGMAGAQGLVVNVWGVGYRLI